MKTRIIVIAVIAAGLGITTPRAMAGIITGFARDLDGKAIGRVRITIRRSDNNSIVPQTDANGRPADYSLSAPNGAYTVNLPDGVFVIVTFSQSQRTPAILQHVDVKDKGPVSVNVALPERKCQCCFRRCYRRRCH